jgi:hypothetical protein
MPSARAPGRIPWLAVAAPFGIGIISDSMTNRAPTGVRPDGSI